MAPVRHLTGKRIWGRSKLFGSDGEKLTSVDPGVDVSVDESLGIVGVGNYALQSA